jgi:hypothetical protein
MNIAFHNLFLQLEYLENATRILKSDMIEIYDSFFPKKIYNNLLYLDKVFNDISKDWEADLNHRFLKHGATLEGFF